jgi:thiol-disulfide isomerase/thioredoxin
MTASRRLVPVALAIVAALIGIYWFQGVARKPASAPAQIESSAGLKRYATGALAGFVIKTDRAEVPDLAFQDAGAAAVKLSQWKGRVVLINLWATWCGPCRKEMPSLAALQSKLGSKDFEVVAISVDRKGAEVAAPFLKETGAAALALYLEPTARILDELQVLGLPATLLIDRQGREIGRLLGPAEWASPEAEALINAAIAEPVAG